MSWALLSGGMDSSAIVGIAEGLCRAVDDTACLGGAVTLAMRPFTGADTRFAAVVAEHCGVRHEVIEGWSSWEEDELGPPLFDQPGTTLSAYAITRRLTRLVRQAGGERLLCGAGADLYLRHKPDYVADLLVTRRGRIAFSELVALATASRTSFWKLAGRYAIYPNLPPALRKALAPTAFRLPAWLDGSFCRRFALADRTLAVRLYHGTAGARQRERILDGLTHEGSLLPQQHIGEDNLDWRYPFLYRPLVDFALAVPRAWHTSRGINKRLLRAAVRPLLPPRVVARSGKGGLVPQEASAARRKIDLLGNLLRDPILAQLGCIEPDLFRASVANVTEETRAHQSLIDRALQLELWLQLQDSHVTSSRWRARLGASRQPSTSRGIAREVTVHPT
jgi:asparagine synthase (glutamine-hydrolysing)